MAQSDQKWGPNLFVDPDGVGVARRVALRTMQPHHIRAKHGTAASVVDYLKSIDSASLWRTLYVWLNRDRS